MTVASTVASTRSRGWKGIGELLVELVVFGAPAFFLSGFLMELTGGALWVPAEWRRSILAVGLGAGLACFHLARISVQRRYPNPQGPTKLDAEAYSQRRTLLWATAAVVMLCVHTWLRFECVRAWDPNEASVVSLFSDQRFPLEPDADIGFEPVDVSGLRPPVYLEPGPPYRGSFLFPFGFPNSDAGRRLVDQVRYRQRAERADLRGAVLRDHATELIAIVRDDERRALARTVTAFVIVHFFVLCVASVAYGYGFSWAEETAGGLRQLFS